MRSLSCLLLVLVLLVSVAMAAMPSAGEHFGRHDHGGSQANAMAAPLASADLPQGPGAGAFAEGQLPACHHQPARQGCQMATSLAAVTLPVLPPLAPRTVGSVRVPGPSRVDEPVFRIFRPPTAC